MQEQATSSGTAEARADLATLAGTAAASGDRAAIAAVSELKGQMAELDAENERLVQAFLDRRPDFRADDLQAAAPPGLPVWQHPRVGRFLQTLPHRDRTDGIFIAKLERST